MTAPGVEARRAALFQLEGDPMAIRRHIEGFLRDDDWRVRKDAAALAARHVGAASLAKLLASAVLQGEDVGLRNAAIEALVRTASAPEDVRRDVHLALSAVETGAPHTALKFLCAAWVGGGALALPRLAHHARDPDPTTASAAVEALARIGGAAAERELEAVAFRPGDDVVRLAAIEGLVALGARLPVARLSTLFERPLFARPVVALLGQSADPAAIEPLVERLQEARFCADAAVAIARLLEVRELYEPSARAVAGLGPEVRARLSALTSERRDEPVTARAALTILLLSGDTTAVSDLARFGARNDLGRPLMDAVLRLGARGAQALLNELAVLDAPSAAWAIEVAVELAESSDDAALRHELRSALREALRSGSEPVQVAALHGLRQFGEAEDAARLVSLGAHGSTSVASAASDAIGALANAAPEAALTALQQEDEDAPMAWSKAAAALPRELAIEKLNEAAVAADPAVRRASIDALVHVGGDEAAELAAFALADEDETVRHTAVRTLAALAAPGDGQTASPRALAALPAALRSGEAKMRAVAVRAAAERNLDLDPVALELAFDPSPEVEAALFRALAQPGQRAVSPAMRSRLIEPLSLATTHEDDEVVKSAMAALVACRAPEVGTALVAGLSHRAWDVRLEAARLIGALLDADPGARSDQLRRALAVRRTVEEDDLVREAIDGALSSFWASGSWPPGGDA